MLQTLNKVRKIVAAVAGVGERLWQFVLFSFGLTAASVMAWLSQTWSWYWQTFNLAGTAIAFLVSFFVISFGTFLFSIAAAIYARRMSGSDLIPEPDGPIIWSDTIEIVGPIFRPSGFGVRGRNQGKMAVTLRNAYLVSSISGKRLEMKIHAVDSEGTDAHVPLDAVNAIPPGAPIQVFAEVGSPNHNPSVEELLKDWGRFQFCAEDNVRTYQRDYSESFMSIFYPGLVGPRVTMKKAKYSPDEHQ